MAKRKVTLEELESWLNTRQTAKRLGRSNQTVINLAMDRRLRGVHVGVAHGEGKGVWIFDPADVEEYGRMHGIKEKGGE